MGLKSSKIYVLTELVNGKHILADQQNFIPDREEWEKIKEIVSNAYESLSDEEIAAHNEALYDAIFKRRKGE